MNTAYEETRSILAALSPNMMPDSWNADRAERGVHWRNMIIRSIVIGLAPQLYSRFAAWKLQVPPSEAAKLEAAYNIHAERNRSLYRQFAELMEAFHPAGITPIALKGMHLAALIYPDPGLRPMNDIDLLFAPQELQEAEHVLLKLNYEKKYTSPRFGPGITKHTTTFARKSPTPATANPYLSGGSQAVIEPHRSLEESWFGLRVDITPGVRKRSQQADYKGLEFRILSPEDLLLHLSVHFSFHLIMGMPSLVQLLDLQMVINKGPALDWNSLVTRAKKCDASPFVGNALALSQKLLGAQVPVGAEAELLGEIPPGLFRKLKAMDLNSILMQQAQKAPKDWKSRLVRGLSDRRGAYIWAANGKMRRSVLLSSLRFWRSDLARILMAKRSA